MPSERVVGTGIVELRARIDKLRKDLANAKKEVRKEVEDMSRFSTISLGTLAGAAAVSVGILGALVTTIRTYTVEAVKNANAIRNTAAALGLTAEQYQEIVFAGSQANLTNQQIDISLRNISRRIEEGDQGLRVYRHAWDSLGISLRTEGGRLKTLNEILPEMADSFDGLESRTEKTAFAMQLFGRSGARMLQLMEGGSERFEKMRQDARDLGLVLDNETVLAADQVADALDRVQKIVSTNLTRAFLHFMPLLLRFAETVQSLAPALLRFTEGLLSASIVGVSELDRRIEEIQARIESFESSAVSRQSGGRIGDMINVGAGRLGDAKAQLRELIALRAIAVKRSEELHNSLLGGGPRPTDDEPTPVEKALKRLRHELEQLDRDEVGKRINDVLFGLDGEGVSGAQNSEIESLLNRIVAREKEIADAKEAQRKNQTALNSRLNEYEQLIESATDEWVLLADKTNQVGLDLAAGNITLEQATKLYEAIGVLQDKLANKNKEFQQTWKETLEEMREGIAERLSDALAEFAVEGEASFKRLGKAFLREFIAVAINQGILRLIQALGGGIGTNVQVSGGTGSARAAGGYPVTGALADGGPARGGSSYLVGERGPEIFTPSMSGTVIPNHELGSIGSEPSVTQNVVINAGVSAQVRQEMLSLMPQLKRATRDSIMDEMRRGGAMSNAIRGAT